MITDEVHKVFSKGLDRIHSIQKDANLLVNVAVQMLVEDFDNTIEGKQEKHKGHSNLYMLELAIEELKKNGKKYERYRSKAPQE